MKISISGHSGYAPSGQDIVCAGISTLGQTAAMMFAEMESAGDLELFTSEKSAGKLLLAIKAYKHTKQRQREYIVSSARARGLSRTAIRQM